jgi:hypothetical protein
LGDIAGSTPPDYLYGLTVLTTVVRICISPSFEGLCAFLVLPDNPRQPLTAPLSVAVASVVVDDPRVLRPPLSAGADPVQWPPLFLPWLWSRPGKIAIGHLQEVLCGNSSGVADSRTDNVQRVDCGQFRLTARPQVDERLRPRRQTALDDLEEGCPQIYLGVAVAVDEIDAPGSACSNASSR